MRLPGIFDSLRDLLDDRGFVVVCTHEDAAFLSPWGRRKRLSFLDLGLQAEGFRGGVDLLGRGGLDGPAFRDPSALVPRPSQVEICGVQDDRAVSFRHGPGPNPRAAIRSWAATNLRTKSDVRAIVDDAIKVAKASRRKTKITFAHEDAIEMNWSIPEQRKLADVSVEEKIAEVQSVDRDLMALGLKIPARYFQFSDNRIVKFFANSEGSRIRSYSPRLRLTRIVRPPDRGRPRPRTRSEPGRQVVHPAGRDRHACGVGGRERRRRSDGRARDRLLSYGR